MTPNSVHFERCTAILKQFGCVGLLVISGVALFQTASVASSTNPAHAKAFEGSAVAGVSAPNVPPLKPLKTSGRRTVSRISVYGTAMSPLPSAGMPQPSRVHLAEGSLPREADQNAAFSTNWSGQVLTGGLYTGVGGQWTVPSVVPTGSAEYSATWIGIDGVSSSSLIQTGTTQETAGGSTTYFAWLELLPGAALTIGNAPVSPGDVMQAAISETSSNVWTIAIQDTTANWTYSGSYNYTTPGVSAEWIEEAPTIGGSQSTLANFGAAAFSNMQIAGSAGTSPVLEPFYMLNPAQTAIIAYPGSFDSSTDSFTDFYGAPPPVVTSVTPSQGDVGGGSNVTIIGAFLLNATVVSFGPSSTRFSLNGNGTLGAVSPAEGAGTVNVTVTTPGGTSTASGADQFTYETPPAPPPSSVPVVNRTLPAPVVGMASLPDGSGYWLADARGGISAHGDAVDYGSMAGRPLNAPISHIVSTPDGKGYWLVAADGGTFTFGDAGFYGSMGGQHLNAPVVDIAPTQSGKGYWLVASDGGIFAFGDAGFYGSMGGQRLNKPVVGISADYATGGYWEVATDGGIFAFGAPFYGSTGNIVLNQPVNGMASTPNGQGYWFIASDGGIFSFGNAQFYGSTGAIRLNAPVVGMASDPTTGGYWMVASDGGIFSFNAAFYGAD